MMPRMMMMRVMMRTMMLVRRLCIGGIGGKQTHAGRD